jgi:anti-anti-sigma factor
MLASVAPRETPGMPDQTQPPFVVEVIGEIAVVRFAGWKVPMEIGNPLYDLLDDAKNHRMLLDLDKVTYMSSNAIAILVSLKKRIDAVGGTLKICRMNADLVEILRHTGLAPRFSIYSEEADALAAF